LKKIPLVLIGLLILSACQKNENRLEVGKAELLYDNNISENQAQKMADFLLEKQYLKKEVYTSVGFKLRNDSFRILLVVDRQYYIDTSYDSNFKELIKTGNESLEFEKPLVLDICDRNYQVKRSVF
jgi:uncharacterized lipoprotein YajG